MECRPLLQDHAEFAREAIRRVRIGNPGRQAEPGLSPRVPRVNRTGSSGSV